MLGAGSILAGAFIGAGIGALSTTAMKAGEEISTGNVRSAGERLAYAVFDDSMSWDEKWAYAFDPGQMVADFVTGVVIGEFLDGMMAATQNKLRSIFANYDAAMREAIESGSGSVTYDELDSLGRTTGIEAAITQDMIGTGSPAKSSIKPAGFGGQAQGHARGHLLGNQLGGSGSDPRNLVTIYQNPVNHPLMSSIEANVRKAVEGGQIVNYRVTPIYEGNNLIPCGITIRAEGSGGLNIYETILNRK